MNTEFKITLPITRAYRGSDGYLYVEGVASDPALDSHETIFNRNCQHGFEFDINSSHDTEEPVKLESEHNGEVEPMNILGPVVSARVTEDSELFIRARLDEANPKAVYYYNILNNPDPKLGRPKKLGLSINGYVIDAHYEMNSELGKQVRVFDRVKLEKIGIVREPSNPNTWVRHIARSVSWTNVNLKENLMQTEENLEVVTTQDEVTDIERAAEETTPEVVEAEVTEDIVGGNTAGDEVEEAVRSEATLTDVISAVTSLAAKVEELTTRMSTADADAHEDLSDEVTCVKCGKVECSCDEEASHGVETVYESESRSKLTVGFEFSGEMLDKIADTVKEVVAGVERSFEEKLADTTKTVENLVRQLEKAESENKELVERIAKLENSPATTPGSQVSLTRSREEDAEDAIRAKIERAKETGDVRTLIKLKFGLE